MAAGVIAGLLKNVLMSALTSKMGGGGQQQGQQGGQQQTGMNGLYMSATGTDPLLMGISEQEMIDRLRKMYLINRGQ